MAAIAFISIRSGTLPARPGSFLLPAWGTISFPQCLEQGRGVMARVQVEKKFQSTCCVGGAPYSMACDLTFCYVGNRKIKMYNTTAENNTGDLGMADWVELLALPYRHSTFT